jgi:hypothetical protein
LLEKFKKHSKAQGYGSLGKAIVGLIEKEIEK